MPISKCVKFVHQNGVEHGAKMMNTCFHFPLVLQKVYGLGSFA